MYRDFLPSFSKHGKSFEKELTGLAANHVFVIIMIRLS